MCTADSLVVHVLGELILKYELKLKFAFIKKKYMYMVSQYFISWEKRERCKAAGGRIWWWEPGDDVCVGDSSEPVVTGPWWRQLGWEAVVQPEPPHSHCQKAGRPQWPGLSSKEMLAHPLLKRVFDVREGFSPVAAIVGCCSSPRAGVSAAPQQVGSSQIRDRTCVLCMGRWIL